MEFTSYIGSQIPRLCCASWRTFCSEASWLNFCHINKVFISNFSSRMEAVNELDSSLSRHEGVSWRRPSSFPLLSHRGEASWYESMNQIWLVIMRFEGLKVVLQETFDDMLGWALLESTLKVVTPTSHAESERFRRLCMDTQNYKECCRQTFPCHRSCQHGHVAVAGTWFPIVNQRHVSRSTSHWDHHPLQVETIAQLWSLRVAPGVAEAHMHCCSPWQWMQDTSAGVAMGHLNKDTG